MKQNVNLWLRGLGSAVITGVSTSALSGLGISGAERAGVDVAALDLKQLAIIAGVGGAVGLFAYLKQSPLPKLPSA